jgi:ATP-dependent DNA ligase
MEGSDQLDAGKVRVASRRGKPLARYFPELVEAAAILPAGTVLDGELVIPADGGADFAALQRRIHPSERRVAELASSSPAAVVAFDTLALRGRDLRGEPYETRRAALVELLADVAGPIGVMPMTTDRAAAVRAWMTGRPAGLEGVVAKRRGEAYWPGKRGWMKIRTRARSLGVVGAVIGPSISLGCC